MNTGESYVALDVGASGGRVVVGTFTGEHLSIEEIHRFPNEPVRVLGSLYWDVLRLWEEIKEGLRRVAAEYGPELAGIGVDTWAQDFGLVDEHGELVGLPHTYRDARTEGVIHDLSRQISEWDLYRQSGLGYTPYTTLSQLVTMRKQGSPALDVAQALLFIPNLFLFWLCGQQTAEATIASLSQLYDATKREWCIPLVEKLGLPTRLLPDIVPTATILGPLLPAVAEEVGLGEVPVIATACHDTAAAAAAVPSKAEKYTFISSGTWSLLGTQLDEPILTEDAMARGFANEGGACNTVIFVRNCIGLWPVQECQRQWRQEGRDWSYAQLTEMAGQARAFGVIVDPDDPAFFRPGDMIANIAEFCWRTGQQAPTEPGGVIRGLLEGLALRYRKSIEDLDVITGTPTEMTYIVGGGSKNALLCQLAADASNRPVLAGPAEATAAGTILLQALARGSLASLSELREVVRRSHDLVSYEPHPSDAWDEAYDTFLGLGEEE